MWVCCCCVATKLSDTWWSWRQQRNQRATAGHLSSSSSIIMKPNSLQSYYYYLYVLFLLWFVVAQSPSTLSYKLWDAQHLDSIECGGILCLVCFARFSYFLCFQVVWWKLLLASNTMHLREAIDNLFIFYSTHFHEGLPVIQTLKLNTVRAL